MSAPMNDEEFALFDYTEKLRRKNRHTEILPYDSYATNLQPVKTFPINVWTKIKHFIPTYLARKRLCNSIREGD